ncbi:lipopolysaccharide biosynthesis protein [Pacificimonas sp. WHA3]|uniref:Lipopolysaccharide biosynthesis protein n=1 Tax=Pacificimonas pallii TaxID=2827236 RepID=A0ABS6SA53_9SPHN|nr:lipopolysaccharide biosynthesis protein [Pacificimonas pallii]MBV7255169.1 lipopolysaccharide biosynthesis protein [Pacificimonas pallii]
MDTQTPPYLLTETEAPPRRSWARRNRWFIALVLAPTALVAAWLFLFAADQYRSETHFLIRSSDPGGSGIEVGGLAQMIGMGGVGGLGGGSGDAISVADYLDSHDAVAAADEKLDLVSIFRAPEADMISRLWSADPEAETLLRHYRRKVGVDYDVDTGITTLTVQAYRPEHAQTLAATLLELGEERVNALNGARETELVESTRARLDEAKAELAAVNGRMAQYRRDERQIDPALSGKAGTELVAALRGELASLRAQEAAMAGVSRDSPQRVAMRRRIASVSGAVTAAEARLSGTAQGAVAAGIGIFETLRMEQELAARRYEMTAAMYDKARADALRQNLFLERVVQPNLPERALYPERFTITLTLLFGLALAYGIGWLILAGVREHAA